MPKLPRSEKNCLGFALVGCFLTLNAIDASAACSSEKCRPASVGDVKALLRQYIAPTPTGLGVGSPVAITAVRTCNLYPNAESGVPTYTLAADTINMYANVIRTDPSTPGYQITCFAPSPSPYVKLYTVSRTNGTVDRTSVYGYDASPVGNTNSTTPTIFGTYTLGIPFTTTVTGVAANLESFLITCSVTEDNGGGNTWTIAVPVPYCS
ncbi:MAG: hypothetical protein CMF38_02900 [Legionellaceae bacterium]|nr:hypothetical protein [Legionellaceae bacterium]HCA89554.1 hypothetical protein [Legionellales bacterium]